MFAFWNHTSAKIPPLLTKFGLTLGKEQKRLRIFLKAIDRQDLIGNFPSKTYSLTRSVSQIRFVPLPPRKSFAAIHIRILSFPLEPIFIVHMASDNHPKVTAFIPVYNRERYVGEAIQSILDQQFQNFELLLIDDGSTDNSLEVIKAFKDPRITIIRNDQNLGIPRTRNRGLEHASGEYIALLDSDDRAQPERLQKQVTFLDSHPEYAQVGSWCQMMDEKGVLLRRIKRQPLSSESIKAELLFRCCLSNRTIMGRTSILKQFGYRNDFFRCQDYDLHVRLSSQYQMANIPECLVLGRVHPQQITTLTPDLGDEKKLNIIRIQLHQLGITFSQEDLNAHLMLSRMRKMKFIPDTAYVRWAEKWLLQLLKANQLTSIYNKKIFAKIIQKKWFHTCWKSQKNSGRPHIMPLLFSPLTRSTFLKG